MYSKIRSLSLSFSHSEQDITVEFPHTLLYGTVTMTLTQTVTVVGISCKNTTLKTTFATHE